MVDVEGDGVAVSARSAGGAKKEAAATRSGRLCPSGLLAVIATDIAVSSDPSSLTPLPNKVSPFTVFGEESRGFCFVVLRRFGAGGIDFSSTWGLSPSTLTLPAMFPTRFGCKIT
ncbi:BQ5605_C002g01403 [Microbotryum silenes-dioicae]|uniref:BQ5605_C002g01403 protein n=1 Tax=Microbotryum silenes-dioicae TaxID=796604 RepID=A0A2X0LYP9_9BASI|nr:BQ5605_C002g01403 [Microbotryum silenes-dioicae]